MVDEVRPPKGDDDEFQFSEAEVEEATSYSDSTESSLAPTRTGGRINRRNVLIALGIIIVAFSLYKLMGVFWADRGKVAAVPSETQPPQIPNQGMVPIQPALPTATLSDVMQEQLSAMQQNAEENRQQINTVTNNLNSLTNEVSNLQSSIQAITQQLQAITSTLQEQQASIVALQPKIKKTIYPVRVRVSIRELRPTWFVRAIIPGRAWLIREDGHQTTVEVGDKLCGYGIIKNISVTKGLVYTSSGAIIKYRGALCY